MMLEFSLRPTIMPRYSLGYPQWLRRRQRQQHVVDHCPRYTFVHTLPERTSFVHASHPTVGHWPLPDRMARHEHLIRRRGDKLVHLNVMVDGSVMRHSRLILVISSRRVGFDRRCFGIFERGHRFGDMRIMTMPSLVLL